MRSSHTALTDALFTQLTNAVAFNGHAAVTFRWYAAPPNLGLLPLVLNNPSGRLPFWDHSHAFDIKSHPALVTDNCRGWLQSPILHIPDPARMSDSFIPDLVDIALCVVDLLAFLRTSGGLFRSIM